MVRIPLRSQATLVLEGDLDIYLQERPGLRGQDLCDAPCLQAERRRDHGREDRADHQTRGRVESAGRRV